MSLTVSNESGEGDDIRPPSPNLPPFYRPGVRLPNNPSLSPFGPAESWSRTGSAAARGNAVPVWYLIADNKGHGFARTANADFLFYAMIAFVQARMPDR